MGFFAGVGPMQIFVSIHLIPPDLKFLPDANPPNFSNEEQVIEQGAMVRIKIMGLKMEVKDIVHSPFFLSIDTVCHRHHQRRLSWRPLVVFV
jgi:DNA-directed RNA polymerase subunit E'/Rpb7